MKHAQRKFSINIKFNNLFKMFSIATFHKFSTNLMILDTLYIFKFKMYGILTTSKSLKYKFYLRRLCETDPWVAFQKESYDKS